MSSRLEQLARPSMPSVSEMGDSDTSATGTHTRGTLDRALWIERRCEGRSGPETCCLWRDAEVVVATGCRPSRPKGVGRSILQ